MQGEKAVGCDRWKSKDRDRAPADRGTCARRLAVLFVGSLALGSDGHVLANRETQQPPGLISHGQHHPCLPPALSGRVPHAHHNRSPLQNVPTNTIPEPLSPLATAHQKITSSGLDGSQPSHTLPPPTTVRRQSLPLRLCTTAAAHVNLPAQTHPSSLQLAPQH